jgi:hypothetical protein
LGGIAILHFKGIGVVLLLSSKLAAVPAAAATIAPTKFVDYRNVSVSKFGTKCDGVSDDTNAIRAAASAVPTEGAVLHFPKGRCVIHGTIYLKSHTQVRGERTTLLAATPWKPDYETGYALLENVHHYPGGVRDTDISVNGMTFDYGDFGPVAVPKGGKHAVRFEFADDISISNNVFQLHGAEDAVAGLGVTKLRLHGNSAFEFRNCAYDFWYGPSKVTITGNLAETTVSSQMINFNPEQTDGEGGDNVAMGLVMSDNTLTVTGPNAVPVQIEPLGVQTSVRDVAVSGNKLRNVYLVLRGDVRRATIRDNTITDVEGGAPAFEAYPLHGGTPDTVNFSDNVIVDPHTQSDQFGVVRLEALNSLATGNSITGRNYHSAAIYHGDFSVLERSNAVSPE